MGAVAPGSSLAAAPEPRCAGAADGTKFDFDTPYSRIGTDSTKWDGPINTGLTDKDHIVAGMGIADMDFRAAPSITQALNERMKHERLGYMVIPKSFHEASSPGAEALRHRHRSGGCWTSPPASTRPDRRAARVLASRAARCC